MEVLKDKVVDIYVRAYEAQQEGLEWQRIAAAALAADQQEQGMTTPITHNQRTESK